MRSRLIDLSVLVLPLVLGGCSQRGFDPAAEEAKLSRRDAEWAELASAGKDVEKIVSYWSDDAVLIFPGQPVLEGKAAIGAYVAESLKTPGFKIHWVSEKPVFSPDGKLAYLRGKDELTWSVSLAGKGILLSLVRFTAPQEQRCNSVEVTCDVEEVNNE